MYSVSKGIDEWVVFISAVLPLEPFAMYTLTPGFFNIERRAAHSKGWVVNKFYAKDIKIYLPPV